MCASATKKKCGCWLTCRGYTRCRFLGQITWSQYEIHTQGLADVSLNRKAREDKANAEDPECLLRESQWEGVAFLWDLAMMPGFRRYRGHQWASCKGEVVQRTVRECSRDSKYNTGGRTKSSNDGCSTQLRPFATMSHSMGDEMKGNQVAVPTVPLWINNQPHTSNITFPVVNAENDVVVHRVYSATPELARKAVESADRAFQAWRDTKPWHRRTLLLKAAEYLEERRKEVAEMARVRSSQEYLFRAFLMPAKPFSFHHVARGPHGRNDGQCDG